MSGLDGLERAFGLAGLGGQFEALEIRLGLGFFLLGSVKFPFFLFLDFCRLAATSAAGQRECDGE